MKLHLGVNDVPEFEEDVQLYDVAVDLERHYRLFSTFVDLHKDDIESEIVNSLNSQLSNIIAGQPSENPLQGGLENIENLFQEYLTKEEMAGVVKGVPTRMAFFNKSRIPDFKRRGQSFVDTGTLRANLRVWIEE